MLGFLRLKAVIPGGNLILARPVIAAALILLSSTAALPLQADSPKGAAPHNQRFALQLLPDVIELLDPIVRSTASEKHAPEYVSLSAGHDEYVYHLRDKVFIRVDKGRYELPAWRVCGDFAVVRVELMDEWMRNSIPVMAWYMIFREDRWQHLTKNEDGAFVYGTSGPVELPPYAARCFNLDRKELLDR